MMQEKKEKIEKLLTELGRVSEDYPTEQLAENIKKTIPQKH